MVTFVHTADWQIGKTFARVEDATKRALLQDERLRAIGRLKSAIDEHGVSFVLVAGDLFESSTVPRSTVSKALSEIGRLSVPVHVIPGNHDHGGVGGIWEQPYFQQERDSLAPNLNVITAAEPIELDDVVLLPCPLLRRHEVDDPSRWLRQLEGSWQAVGDKARVIIAHGSVYGFVTEEAADEEEIIDNAPNRLNLDELPSGEFDYVALGDWHGTKRVNDRAWYAGALEQDRFAKGDDYEAGNALVVSVERGGTPNVQPVSTGGVAWHSLDFQFTDDASLENLAEQVDQLVENRVDADLLELSLSGSLSFAARDKLEQLLDTWQNRLIRLKLSDTTSYAPTEEEIQALTERVNDPLIAQVAAALVEEAAGDSDEAEVAQQALRELYRLAG